MLRVTEGTIFIVEDNPVIADLISWRLSEMGYRVAGIAEDSASAMIKVNEIRPDLILMDINLPGEKDGIEVAQEIIDTYNIPIVYISSILDERIMERAKVTKPRGYIVKPFTDNQLKATIEMAMQS